jgi:ribonuclease VapC
MVVDPSALFAILFQEAEADRFSRAIQADRRPKISTASLVEASAVALGRGGSALLHELRREIEEGRIEMTAFSARHAEFAIEAYRRYGRGVGNPGCLNFGDCFSYALAKADDEPLLYKGEDFAKTDIRSAL